MHVKRRKVDRGLDPEATVSERHPLGVQPSGNSLMSCKDAIDRERSLGVFGALTDEQILEILSLLDARDLGAMCGVSRAMHVLANSPDLWKEHCLKKAGMKGFEYQGSWKTTYLHVLGINVTDEHEPRPAGAYFSDTIFQPWFFSRIDIDPNWLKGETIPRRAGLTREQFIENYEKRHHPVILSDMGSDWPALTKWTTPYLLKVFKDRPLKAGQTRLSFPNYLRYAVRHMDERPLYVFDKDYVTDDPDMVEHYQVPYISRDRDLFDLLPEKARPEFRWIVIGPYKSGSSWHVDPNATSAWNAVISGAKRWIMCPPHAVPPGVFPSPDGSAVATPISVTEWYMNYYKALKSSDVPYIEGTVRPGEVIYVPSGWWHMVLNLDHTVALTHNFVTETDLPRVYEFLRTKPDQTSLVRCEVNLYGEFVKALEEHRPELFRRVKEEFEAKQKKAKEGSGLWAKLQTTPVQPVLGATVSDASTNVLSGDQTQSSKPSGFSFGFS